MRIRRSSLVLALCGLVALATLSALVALVGPGGRQPASADIDSHLGLDFLATPPPSVRENVAPLESDDHMFAFDERQAYALTAPLQVDDIFPPFDCTRVIHVTGSGGGSNRTAGVIPAGMTVSSHFLHADPVGSPATHTELQGRVHVDQPILGLIFREATLDDSDYLGASITAYPISNTTRGLEYNVSDPDADLDTLRVGCTGSLASPAPGGTAQTVDATLYAAHMDQVRIITDEHPNCSGASVTTNENTTSGKFSLNCPVFSSGTDSCSVVSQTNAALGALDITNCVSATYSPSVKAYGSDTVTYMYTDPLGQTTTANVNVTVTQDVTLDSDGDGCKDVNEQQTAIDSQTSGGRRNKKDFWDFYDVWTHPMGNPTGWERDKKVTFLAGDIIGVISRFGATRAGGPPTQAQALAEALTPPTSDSGYHADFDRGPVVGPNVWNLGPPNGQITFLGGDIIFVISQFNHNCQ